MSFLIATLIALALTALLLCVCALLSRISERRVFREMATFACPYCILAIGLKAVSDGRDYTPYEELWDLQGEMVHCHPTCRSVKCQHCGECVLIRLNREGERFGPRLSADDAEQGRGRMVAPPELVAELREWLAEYRNCRARDFPRH